MLNNIGLPGLLLIAVVVLVLFGRGKISSLMGEVGKGITAFKRGVSEGSKEDDTTARRLESSEDVPAPGLRTGAAPSVHAEPTPVVHPDTTPGIHAETADGETVRKG